MFQKYRAKKYFNLKYSRKKISKIILALINWQLIRQQLQLCLFLSLLIFHSDKFLRVWVESNLNQIDNEKNNLKLPIFHSDRGNKIKLNKLNRINLFSFQPFLVSLLLCNFCKYPHKFYCTLNYMNKFLIHRIHTASTHTHPHKKKLNEGKIGIANFGYQSHSS